MIIDNLIDVERTLVRRATIDVGHFVSLSSMSKNAFSTRQAKKTKYFAETKHLDGNIKKLPARQKTVRSKRFAPRAKRAQTSRGRNWAKRGENRQTRGKKPCSDRVAMRRHVRAHSSTTANAKQHQRYKRLFCFLYLDFSIRHSKFPAVLLTFNIRKTKRIGAKQNWRAKMAIPVGECVR